MVAPSAAVGAAVSQMCISRAPPEEWCTGFKNRTNKKTKNDFGAGGSMGGSHGEFIAVKRVARGFTTTSFSGRGGELINLYTALVYRGDAGFFLGEGYKLRVGHEVMDGAS